MSKLDILKSKVSGVESNFDTLLSGYEEITKIVLDEDIEDSEKVEKIGSIVEEKAIECLPEEKKKQLIEEGVI